MKNIKICPVEGITTEEIETAISGDLYCIAKMQWNTSGGYESREYRVSTAPVSTAPMAAVIADSPSNGPVPAPLVRAIEFNAYRTADSNSVFITDPRIQALMEALESLPLDVPHVWSGGSMTVCEPTETGTCADELDEIDYPSP